MARPIAQLRDDFENNIQDPLWGEAAVTGSATKAETGGQCVLALPSSTAGSHSAIYRTSGRYDLTGGSIYVNIGTMVSTSVAANAFVQLIDIDNTVGQLYWQQVSGTLTARKIEGAVNTALFTTTWNATTYKYLRIREASGTIFYDSSTDGVTWTNRATTTTTTPITSMAVQLATTCGNVASPGSFRISDVNLILPALTTNWRWSQCERPSVDYVKTITVAATSGQGYIATSTDGVTWAYYAGPIGSASGGYDQLALAASQAAAENMAVNLPASTYARWDLPSLVQCRFVRLYHRSITGSSYRVDEFYPRRLVQSDDIEAESIKAINIAAATITADKINVINLAALSAQMGTLHMDGVIDIASGGGIYQGSGTFASPMTGLKLFNSSGVGKLSTYNSAVEQVTLDTDGKLKAGAGNVLLDANGLSLAMPLSNFSSTQAMRLTKANLTTVIATVDAYYLTVGTPVVAARFICTGGTGEDASVEINATTADSTQIATLNLFASRGLSSTVSIILNDDPSLNTIQIDAGATGYVKLQSRLNVGTTTSGAGDGEIRTSGNVGFGAAPVGAIRTFSHGATSNNTTYTYYSDDSANGVRFYVRNDGVGFLGAAAWTYSSDLRLKENIAPMESTLANLLALRPVTFDYISGQKNQFGFIAQEVQEVLPELVSRIDEADENSLLGLQTTNLIPMLVQALQELVSQYRSDVGALRSELAALSNV